MPVRVNRQIKFKQIGSICFSESLYSGVLPPVKMPITIGISERHKLNICIR